MMWEHACEIQYGTSVINIILRLGIFMEFLAFLCVCEYVLEFYL
jgi:hypothetical protein